MNARVISFLTFAALSSGGALAAQTLDKPCPTPPFCGEDCSNKPFFPTACMTTSYGPTRADVVVGNPLESPNMLFCPSGGAYALCFFSGPPNATGTSSQNQRLPCVPVKRTPPCGGAEPCDPPDVARCECQVYNSGAYYVDINSILNLGAWYETRVACGPDGRLCKNIRDCDQNGNTKTCDKKECPKCPAQIAPVCTYVNAQSSHSSAALYPDPKLGTSPQPDLVSTFSFAMSTATCTAQQCATRTCPAGGTCPPYTLGSSPCSGTYAGCMTAPCWYAKGTTTPPPNGTAVTCECPIWQGDYQVGQTLSSLQPPANACGGSDGAWVWSAARSVPVVP